MTGARNFKASGATPRFDLYFLSNGARRLQACSCMISPFSRTGTRYLRDQLRPFLKICPRCIYPPGSQPCFHCRPIKPNVPPDSQARNLISATRPRFLEDPGQWNFQAFCKLLGRQDVLRIHHGKSGEYSPPHLIVFRPFSHLGKIWSSRWLRLIPKRRLINPIATLFFLTICSWCRRPALINSKHQSPPVYRIELEVAACPLAILET